MKIAVITCYYEPDYVRNRVMREAFRVQDNVEVLEIKNTHRGVLRYPEVFWKTLRLKIKEKPDAFFLTFRGQEILPLILMVAGRKPVWFDEFIVPGAYIKQEKRKSLSYKVKVSILRTGLPVYNFFLRRSAKILTDTLEHAKLSSEISHINLDKYLAIPVGTDEKLFYPDLSAKKAKPFRIFYYSSNMQPLLGVPVVLEAAERLKDDDSIEFLMVGGKQAMKEVVEASQAKGARIKYLDWVPFEEMPKIMRESGLCLGGPFGGTPQANKVITGKTYQSLACQVPTVIGENEATKLYFIDHVNSLIVPQNNVQALVDIFVWAQKHPQELEKIAKHGRELYEKHFSAEALAKLIKPLIN